MLVTGLRMAEQDQSLGQTSLRKYVENIRRRICPKLNSGIEQIAQIRSMPVILMLVSLPCSLAQQVVNSRENRHDPQFRGEVRSPGAETKVTRVQQSGRTGLTDRQNVLRLRVRSCGRANR